jgi:hypothetical protein
MQHVEEGGRSKFDFNPSDDGTKGRLLTMVLVTDVEPVDGDLLEEAYEIVEGIAQRSGEPHGRSIDKDRAAREIARILGIADGDSVQALLARVMALRSTIADHYVYAALDVVETDPISPLAFEAAAKLPVRTGGEVNPGGYIFDADRFIEAVDP